MAALCVRTCILAAAALFAAAGAVTLLGEHSVLQALRAAAVPGQKHPHGLQIGSTEDQPGSWMARAGATLPDFLLEASDSPLRRTVRILELSAILLPLLASPCQQFLIVAQCISRGRVGLAGAAYAPFLSTHWSLPAWMQSNHFTTLNGESGSMRECTTPVMHDTLQRVLLIL